MDEEITPKIKAEKENEEHHVVFPNQGQLYSPFLASICIVVSVHAHERFRIILGVGHLLT